MLRSGRQARRGAWAFQATKETTKELLGRAVAEVRRPAGSVGPSQAKALAAIAGDGWRLPATCVDLGGQDIADRIDNGRRPAYPFPRMKTHLGPTSFGMRSALRATTARKSVVAILLGLWLGASGTPVQSASPSTAEGLPVRGLHLAGPAKRDVPALLQFIREELPKEGINTLILEINYGFDYQSRPEFASPDGLGKAEVQQIARTCRERHIELIPQINSRPCTIICNRSAAGCGCGATGSWTEEPPGSASGRPVRTEPRPPLTWCPRTS